MLTTDELKPSESGCYFFVFHYQILQTSEESKNKFYVQLEGYDKPLWENTQNNLAAIPKKWKAKHFNIYPNHSYTTKVCI